MPNECQHALRVPLFLLLSAGGVLAGGSARAQSGANAPLTAPAESVAIAAPGNDGQGAIRRASPVVWRLDTSLMVSDNLGAGTGFDGKDAGLMLRVAPGVRYARSGASASWLVDYSLQGQRYVRTAQQGKPFQNSLRANGSVSLAGSALTFDGQANIAQRSRSVFDIQRPQGQLGFGGEGLGDTTEVGSLSVGPTLRLRLGEAWRANLKHTATVSRARGTQVGDVTGQATALNIDPVTRALLSLGFALSHQRSEPTEGRGTETADARLRLTWRPDVDWTVAMHTGQERTNLQTLKKVSGETYGVNATWSPSRRTRVQLSGDHRVIGNFHTVSLDHRFSRASISYSDTRSVNQVGVVGNSAGTTNYDLYFAQLAAREPDPIQRDILVRQRLAELGLAADASVTNGFLSSQPSVSRARSLGLTYQQVRTLWNVNMSKSRTSGLVGGGLGNEDLANSAFVDVSGVQAGWTYRVTPGSAVRVLASWQRNQGENAAVQRNELSSLVLGWQIQLGSQVQVAAGLRHSEFDSPTRPFTENALLVNVQQRF